MKKYIPYLLPILLAGCGNSNNKPDATGVFEADEILVSSEISGRILQMNLQEGDTFSAGRLAVLLDAQNLILQREQVEASANALQDKTNDVGPQIALLQDQFAVQQTQLNALKKEQRRVQNLFNAKAATEKNLDDINAQVSVLEKQMTVTQQQIRVQQSQTGTMNRGILAETNPLKKREAQIQDMESKAKVLNPITGTVLAKYANVGEIAAAGKALYKIANMGELTLRAYITGNQLSKLKLKQKVNIKIDEDKDKKREGEIYWISDKAEFTPKTIQTKDERAHLVYAIKVRVKNDGFLKIGMYGELFLLNN
jgi:HlyD family secretion protein